MQLKVSGPTTRYCPACRQDVTDVGGYCLLGHDLRLASAVPRVERLRTEVDDAFDDARVEIERAFEDVRAHVAVDAAVVVAPAGPPPPPPPPPAPVHAPPAPPHAVVPPPADASDGFVARAATVWRSLEHDEAALAGDPIEAFAPPPRMDWGPERPALLSRSGRRARLGLRRSAQAAH
ncbi:MAG TPA: hypothetical protein VHJ34_10135 [Actinomycetota bacterium]|nr:hypothetical protein [Actinomycetota bacterium]